MKICPQCFGNGKEVDEKGFTTGHICPTCGGDGEVTDKEYESFHKFYGSQYADKDYVNDSWRITREENRLRQLSMSESSDEGGRCGLIVGFIFLMPVASTLYFLSQWNI